MNYFDMDEHENPMVVYILSGKLREDLERGFDGVNKQLFKTQGMAVPRLKTFLTELPDHINEEIHDLQENAGLSLSAIKEYIRQTYNIDL